MTNNQQYYDKQQQKQQQKQYQHTSTTSTTTTRTRSQACSDPTIELQIEQLTEVYNDVFGGHGIPMAICQYFARLIKAGMEPEVIASAINATAWARIPTPYYMRAILQRYMYEGILTAAQLNQDILEHSEWAEERHEDRDKNMF